VRLQEAKGRQSVKNSYPVDFLSAPVYLKMEQLHMKSPGVKPENYVNSTLLTSQTTNYYNWGSDKIAPVTVETKKQTGTSEIHFRYNNYDTFRVCRNRFL